MVVLFEARTVHRAPRVPRDLEDHDGDRETDQGIGDRHTEGNHRSTGDHAQRDVSVGTGMVSVGDESRTVETAPRAGPDARRDLIADEPDHSGHRECPEVCEVLRVDEPLDRRVERNAGADEDRGDDRESGEPLTACASQEERNAEGDGGQGVTEVVDQICEQRHRPGRDEDHGLDRGGDPEHAKADRDGPNAFAGADYRTIYEPVGMAVTTVVASVVVVVVVVVVLVIVGERLGRDGLRHAPHRPSSIRRSPRRRRRRRRGGCGRRDAPPGRGEPRHDRRAVRRRTAVRRAPAAPGRDAAEAEADGTRATARARRLQRARPPSTARRTGGPGAALGSAWPGPASLRPLPPPSARPAGRTSPAPARRDSLNARIHEHLFNSSRCGTAAWKGDPLRITLDRKTATESSSARAYATSISSASTCGSMSGSITRAQ